MPEPENQLDNDKEELRQSILVEFKQVHKLAPADYTENCTNVVMSHIDQYTQSKLKAFADELEKASIHYTDDGLKADGLDPWAVPVVTLKAIKERAGIE